MGRWAQAQRRGSVGSGQTVGELPAPDFDGCFIGIDATHAAVEGDLTGGFPVGVHYWTIEGRDNVIDDVASGQSAADDGHVQSDPFAHVMNVNTVSCRAAFSNSDGTILLSPWTAWRVVDEC